MQLFICSNTKENSYQGRPGCLGIQYIGEFNFRYTLFLCLKLGIKYIVVFLILVFHTIFSIIFGILEGLFRVFGIPLPTLADPVLWKSEKIMSNFTRTVKTQLKF